MSSNWLDNTPKEIIDKINSLPDNFEGFKSELLERPDIIGNVEVKNLAELGWTDHFAFAIFNVFSKVTGNTYKQEYISRRGGKYHSLRGIVLIKINGRITHFVVRKCDRFGIAENVYESIGNIYQPQGEFRKDKIVFGAYVENEIAKCLHLPKIRVEKFYDLGNVYTDTSMFNNIVRIFAISIELNDPNEIKMYTEGKVFDEKQYAYTIETIPIENFFEFFSKIADSYLLSIFGRLQALNVVNL